MRALTALALVVGMLGVASPTWAVHARFGTVLTIDPASAHTLLERAGVAPIDLRAEPEFRAGRVPGARSWPLPTITSHLPELPAAGVIILYGDGPIESVLGAYHLIRPRTAAQVYVLEGGLDGRRRAGYRLER